MPDISKASILQWLLLRAEQIVSSNTVNLKRPYKVAGYAELNGAEHIALVCGY